jgi:hypothetical protein
VASIPRESGEIFPEISCSEFFPQPVFRASNQNTQKSMSGEQIAFLCLRTFPARFNMQQTAWFLGVLLGDVTTLVEAKLLKPLGHPPKTGSKYFSYRVLAQLREDPAWLAKASDAIVHFWRHKNESRRNGNAALVDSAA